MATNTLYLRTPAKINLSLVVLGRREDGYHELLTEMVMIDLFDELLLEKVSDPGIHIRLSGRPVDGDPEKNLVVRALTLLVESAKKKRMHLSGGFAADLTKNIPVGAGLGGGSSNAAIALWGGNRLMGHPLSLDEMRAIGRGLGADVPFFLGGPRAMGVGRGDILVPLPPPQPFAVLLWNPEIPLPTPSVYRALDPADLEYKETVELTEKERSNRIGSLLKSGDLVNSLEKAAIGLCPQIADGIDFLERFRPGNVRMTGSGPTVFARFDSREKALGVAREMGGTLGGWTGVFEGLLSPPVPGV